MPAEPAADVLVVDDDLSLLRSMDRALRAIGYQTFAATEAFSALDVLRARRFALLVLDVQMPRMSGIELAGRIRAGDAGNLNRDVPIVFVTADDSVETYQATFDVSAIRYLAKPVRSDVLEREIDRVIHTS